MTVNLLKLMTLIHPNNRLQDKRLNSKSVHNKGNQLVDARLPAHGLNCAQKSRSTTLYRISKLNLILKGISLLKNKQVSNIRNSYPDSSVGT